MLACTQEPEFEADSPIEYASIEVGVFSCDVSVDPFCDTLSPIIGATVLVFENEEDRAFGEPVLFENITGPTGKTTFNQLEQAETYFLRTLTPLGVQETSEKTPNRGTAFHELIFPE